jgi:uncharacterized protein DUF4331
MRLKTFCNTLISAAVTLTALSPGMLTQAASHREAPLIAQDPAADITDTYAFRSWEGDMSKVVFIMNVIPAQEPSSGPNYFFFDDNLPMSHFPKVCRSGRQVTLVRLSL